MMARRGERPGHSATTAHFQAAYPFLAQGGLGAPGVYVGTDAFGGAWAFDPWELYARGVMRSPNIIVLGGISYAKSTLIKTYLYRQHVFGRHAWVIDVKGEYGPLARALGQEPIALEPGGAVRLNPLERRGGEQTQLALLRTITKATLKRDLRPEEDAALRVALRQVDEEARPAEPTLPMVVAALLDPRQAMVEAISARDPEDFAAAARDVALGLQRLCEGDLKGMFDGPTSAGIDLEGAIVVWDLSSMRDSDALGVVIACLGSWLQATLLERRKESERTGVPMVKVFPVFEEVWRIAGILGITEWLQIFFKLCRALGIAVIVSVHKLTDFGTAGGEGSRAARIARSLAADAGCIVIYRQSPDQRAVLREDLGRSDTEVELAMDLGIGEAIWVIGSHSALVRQRLSAAEREITWTDDQMSTLR